MLSWTLTFCIFVAILLGWFWQNSLSARERANHAAQDACARMQLQFLDGTVAFAGVSLTRVGGGHITLRRTYVFDYTAASIERRQGFVVMLGQRIEHIGFDRADNISSRQPLSNESANAGANGHDSNVLDLEEWRRRRASLPSSKGNSPNAASESQRDSGKDNGW